MLTRRAVIGAFAGFAVAAPSAAQPRVPSVGFVALAARESHARDMAALRAGLREIGHVEGQTIAIAERYADGDIALAERQTRDLMQSPPAVFLAAGPAAARTILRVTRSIPIVALGLHPRGGQSDLFESLARPGGMVTGFSNFGEELAARRVQLLKEVMPQLKSVGVLHNAADPVYRHWGEETAAEVKAQGLAALQLPLTSASAEALSGTLRAARSRAVEAVIVVRDFLSVALRREIARSCLEFRLAAIAEDRTFPDSGALMSYGASDVDMFRRSAAYLDKIIRGQVVAELPVQLPTKFELVANLKTAKAIGLAVPESILIRADELVE